MDKDRQEAVAGLGFFLMFAAFLLLLLGWKEGAGSWMAALSFLRAAAAVACLLWFLNSQSTQGSGSLD